MRHLVSRPHIILSVQNPKFPGKTNVSHEVALKALQKLGGGEVHSLQGHYDGPETSILISNPSDKQSQFARHLAHVTGQESHIESDGHSHKMYFNNGPEAGKVIHGTGTTFFDSPPENYFSTLPDGSTFSHHFDFNKSEKGIVIPKKDFIDEHKKLLNILEHPTKQKLQEEAKEQSKELAEKIKHLGKALSSPHWKSNSDTDIENEYAWEVKNRSRNKALFPTFDHFKNAIKNGEIKEITPEMDFKIDNRSRCRSIQELKELTSTYQHPRDVNQIVEGLKTKTPLPHPIVVKKDGIERVLSGNTRMDASFLHGINPHVVYVDLDKVKKSEALEKGARGDWEKEGYTVSHELSDPRASGPYNPKKHDFKVTAHDTSGKKVGFVYFAHHPDGLMAVNAEVDSAHRQKGLGRAMAELAVKASGKRIKKSPDMTSVAQKVWGALSAKTKKDSALGKSTIQKLIESESPGVQKSDLSKAKPIPHFRAYGERGRAEQDVFPIATSRQAKIAAKAAQGFNRRAGYTKTDIKQQNYPTRMKEIASGVSGPRAGLQGLTVVAHDLPEAKAFAKPGDEATALHEGFHASLNRLSAKHGRDQYKKILDVMEAHIHPDDAAAFKALLHSTYGEFFDKNRYKENALAEAEKRSAFREEVLAHINTFLNSKEHRDYVNFAITPDNPNVSGDWATFATPINRAINRFASKGERVHAYYLKGLKDQASKLNPARLSSSWAKAVKWANAQKPPVATSQGVEKLAASEKSDLSNLSKASKNVREQRKRIFGTDPNAPRVSDKRMKMMQQIRRYAEKKYGLPLVTASGKRDEAGQLKEEKGIEQQPYDVFSPKGVAQEKKRQSKLKELGIKRVDPKPDWRSGQLETQPSPDAAVHELSHLDLAPEEMTAADFQSEMDRLWGESQKKYGHLQQKKTQGEIQPMSVENPLRRELGLPANRSTKPVDENQPALDDPSQKRFVEGVNPKTGEKLFLDRQSRLQSPDTKERRTQISEGSLKFDPKKGWYRASDTDALINLRARGLEEEAKTRLKQRSKTKVR